MIVESLVDLFFTMFGALFQGLEIVGLPMQAINALSTMFAYGTWIVGADIMAIFTSMVVGWWLLKLTLGIVIFVWELLPLT